jgi:hypothetical protein
LKIPKFILKKLYVKGSLTSSEDGFEVKMKNVLADATIISPIEIKVDNNDVPLENIHLVSPDGEVSSAEVTSDNPLPFKVKTEVLIKVSGVKLEPGTHKVEFKTKTKEYGDIQFDIKDKV